MLVCCSTVLEKCLQYAMLCTTVTSWEKINNLQFFSNWMIKYVIVHKSKIDEIQIKKVKSQSA